MHENGMSLVDTQIQPQGGELDQGATPPLFRPEDAFDISLVPGELGAAAIQRQISPYEMAYTLGDHSYTVWTEGPKAGRVYRVVQAPKPEQLEGIKTAEQIEAEVLVGLREIEEIEHDARTNKGWPYSRLTDLSERKMSKIMTDLYRVYYGDEQTVGLETAQLFDLAGEGQKYYDWVQGVGSTGLVRYIRAIGESNNVANIKNFDPDASYLYYFRDKTMTGTPFSGYDATVPMRLTHLTMSDALVNIVQLAGLASPNNYQSQGIQKRFGGESGEGRSSSPGTISFWYWPSGETRVDPDFMAVMTGTGFAYPMVAGIDNEHAASLELLNGESTAGEWERKVRDFASITHLFVPHFKTAEVRRILGEHGMGQVQVLSFGGEP